jgi:hypothetical protein
MFFAVSVLFPEGGFPIINEAGTDRKNGGKQSESLQKTRQIQQSTGFCP